MNKYLNQTVKSLVPSATLAIKERVQILKAEGREVINLGGGEPDYDTPDFVKEAAITAIRDGQTKYTAVPGMPALRNAIAERLARVNGISGLSAKNVLVTNGGKQAIAGFFAATLDPLDEVIISAPYWVSYPDQVKLCGGVPVIVQTSVASGYKLTPQQLEAAITEKSKILVLNSPSNPTGAVYSASEIISLVKVAREHDLLILSDEVYDQVLLDPNLKYSSVAAASPDDVDRIATVNAFSKSYSMTGWRIGYLAAHPAIISAVSKIQGQTTSNVNTPTQFAALAACHQTSDSQQKFSQTLRDRLVVVKQLIEETKGISLPLSPAGAFYLFIRIDQLIEADNQINSGADFADLLLEQAGVAVVPGEAFGDHGAVRISLCNSEEILRQAFSKISAVLTGL